MYYSSLSEERITHNNIDSIRVKFQQKADSAGFRTEKDPSNNRIYIKKLLFPIYQITKKILLFPTLKVDVICTFH